MKHLFPILLLALTGFAAPVMAQTPAGGAYAALPKDSASQRVTYTAVVPVAGASQAELFGRAAEWLARRKEIDMVAGAVSDPASGRQVAFLSFKQPPLSFTDTHSNRYVLAVAIYVKDGRYLYRVDDIQYQNINPMLTTKDSQHYVPVESYAAVKENKRVAATIADFDKRIRALLAELAGAMAGAGGKTTPKGW